MDAIIDFARDKVIYNLIKKLSSSLRVYSKDDMPKKFLFVCGKEKQQEKETNRELLVKRLIKGDQRIECLIAERLYFDDDKYNILHFENLLAEISDYIVILLESPGTFCELGAFVNNDIILDKLIVINEDNINFEKSFITKGPLRLIDEKGNLVLYQGHVLSSPKVLSKIKTLCDNAPAKVRHNKVKEEKIELKTLICDLLNIISIFGPICDYEIEYVFKTIFDISKIDIIGNKNMGVHEISEVLKLMCKMDLIKYNNKYYVSNKSILFKDFTFNYDEKEIDEIRNKYLCRVYKDKERKRALI